MGQMLFWNSWSPGNACCSLFKSDHMRVRLGGINNYQTTVFWILISRDLQDDNTYVGERIVKDGIVPDWKDVFSCEIWSTFPFSSLVPIGFPNDASLQLDAYSTIGARPCPGVRHEFVIFLLEMIVACEWPVSAGPPLVEILFITVTLRIQLTKLKLYRYRLSTSKLLCVTK